MFWLQRNIHALHALHAHIQHREKDGVLLDTSWSNTTRLLPCKCLTNKVFCLYIHIPVHGSTQCTPPANHSKISFHGLNTISWGVFEFNLVQAPLKMTHYPAMIAKLSPIDSVCCIKAMLGPSQAREMGKGEELWERRRERGNKREREGDREKLRERQRENK